MSRTSGANVARVHLWIVNSLSLSRILGGILYLIIAVEKAVFPSWVSIVVLLAVGIGTDVLDGKLARHWNVASKFGYILDGLGDRAIYIAVLLVLFDGGFILATTVFLLVFRDLLLYGFRSFWSDWSTIVSKSRPDSRLNAGWIRLAFGMKLATFYASDLGWPIAETTAWRTAASVALASAIATSYVLLFRYGALLLKSLFAQNEADQDGQ